LPDVSEGGIKNNDLYNDKELIDDGDLGWYDYGFRSYDAQIGRFPQLDPLTDDYPYYTPYQYAGNEPIANIDLDGLEPLGAIGAATNAAAGFGKAAASSFSNVLSIASIGIHIGQFALGRYMEREGEITIADIIARGKGSDEFKSLLKKAGVNDKNYSSIISFGSFTETNVATKKITLKRKGKSLDDLVLGLTHELSNYIHVAEFAPIDEKLSNGEISPSDYADANLTVEAYGVVSQTIVAGELGITKNQPTNEYAKYKKDNSYRPKMLQRQVKNIRKVTLGDGGGNAYKYYKKVAEKYYEKNKEYFKELKKNKDMIEKFKPPKIKT
jgi:RHS repeat-associated protein